MSRLLATILLLTLLLVGQGADPDDGRRPPDENELRYWLQNALVHHRFTADQTAQALNLTVPEVEAAVRKLNIDPAQRPVHQPHAPLVVLPYPGGRHPRIGFREGAIRPQRETKVSAFAPWPDGGYAVIDVPEAVWFEPEPKQPQLLYLAHTHLPTYWDRQKQKLDPLEWTRHQEGTYSLQRTLPNQVTLTSTVVPTAQGVRMEFAIKNGSAIALTGLRVQMCVMLAGLEGFKKQTNQNKVFATPFAACQNVQGGRWIITGWQRCGKAWGNPQCPCLHADPVLEDCPPGETRRVQGWVSFYEGADVQSELDRLKTVAFRR